MSKASGPHMAKHCYQNLVKEANHLELILSASPDPLLNPNTLFGAHSSMLEHVSPPAPLPATLCDYTGDWWTRWSGKNYTKKNHCFGQKMNWLGLGSWLILSKPCALHRLDGI